MRKVTFIYGKGSIFTGQRFASELVARGTKERDWRVHIVTTPLRERIAEHGVIRQMIHAIMMILRLLWAWCQGLVAVLRNEPVHIGMGQTRFAMLRDGFPLLVKGMFKSDNRAVVGLNGSLFMNWEPEQVESRLLKRIGRASKHITVVGPVQREKLVELGVADEKALHVDNSCLIPSVTAEECVAKQQSSDPLHVLYLSNLIETKGYAQYVEAVRLLAQQATRPLDVTLCGKLVTMDEDTRFQSFGEAEAWLESQLSIINQSDNVTMQWIKGAFGDDKNRLFRQAHVFVLPSFYKTEAQPITILEALASGCAVITTKVGEIPTTVDPTTAILLDDPTPDAIADALRSLFDDEKRTTMARNGWQLFQQRFSYEKHIDHWEQIFRSMVMS